jgi:hypothetical protein
LARAPFAQNAPDRHRNAPPLFLLTLLLLALLLLGLARCGSTLSPALPTAIATAAASLVSSTLLASAAAALSAARPPLLLLLLLLAVKSKMPQPAPGPRRPPLKPSNTAASKALLPLLLSSLSPRSGEEWFDEGLGWFRLLLLLLLLPKSSSTPFS